MDPTRGFDDDPSFFYRNTMEDYHNIMVSNGDGSKRIWATEFGWPVWRFTGDQRFVFAKATSLEQQAAYTVQAYNIARNSGWAGVMFLWNLDYALTCDCESANFGVLTRQGDAPVYAALAAMPK